MSTILDSLKKSSEQRDGNDKTSIDNFNFGSGKQSSSKGFIAIVVIFTIAIAVMYFGYDYIFADEDAIDNTLVNSVNKQVDEQASITGNSTKPKEPQLKPEISKQSVNTTQPATNKKQKPDNKSVKEQLKNIQADNQTQTIIQEESRVEETKVQTKVDSPKSRQSLSEIVADITESNKIQNTEDTPTIKLSMPGEEQTPPVQTQKHLYVYQLPFSIRKDIPKFTLNIHVYDEQPENRIVIINGTRFNIGDLIEEEVLVKDILQEGVLLEFSGQVFLVPKL